MKTRILLPLLVLCVCAPALANPNGTAEVKAQMTSLAQSPGTVPTFSASTPYAKSTPMALSLRDDTGHMVELAAPARRIVALYGAFNDILLDMDLGDLLVGRTKADTSEKLAHLPMIGTHMRPSEERIVALKPDLILQFEGRREAEEQVNRLRSLGLCVAVFKASSFGDLFRMIHAVGYLTGHEQKATQLVLSLQARLDALAAKQMNDREAGGSEKPRIFFEIRSPNLLAAGTQSMPSAIIEAAGGVNAVKLNDRVARLNEEELIRLDPDVYLVQRGPMNPNPHPLSKRPHYRSLRVTKSGRTLEVDENLFSRPAPGAVDAAEQLAHFLENL